MPSNSDHQYKVIADLILSPDPDIVVGISGDMYKGSTDEANRYITASDLENFTGGSALNYVQVEADQVTVTTSPQELVALTITTTGAPVQINLTGEGSNAEIETWVKVALHRDGTLIGQTIQIESSAVSENVPYALNFIDDVAAGTYVYSAKIVGKSEGDWQFGEVSGPILNAVELAGGSGTGELVIPFIMKDENGDDLLGFEKGGTGVTRIHALQDDLALRSARDIILYPGDDGPGNVYINWGDAEYTPDSTNRVATIADIQAVNTGDITFVDNTISSETGDDIVIQNKNQDDIVKARITLDQGNEQVLLEAIDERSDWFNDTQWSAATWTGTSILITNTPDIINFLGTVPGNLTRISVNNGSTVAYYGYSTGDGSVSIDVSAAPSEDPLTVTEIRFYFSITSKVDINYDNGDLDIYGADLTINIQNSGGNDINITASDDLDLEAGDDVRFQSNQNNESFTWSMNSAGEFHLPGAGYISNPINSSGDANGNDTIHIVPDSNLDSDQYIIIDPTMAPSGPNHIHIRPGGTQDASTVDLILGGEYTHLKVSDTTGSVTLNSNRVSGYDPENQVVATLGDVSTYTRIIASNGSPVTGTLFHVGKLFYANLTATESEFVIPTAANVDFPIGSEIKFATSDESAWYISAADGLTTVLVGENSQNTWTGGTFIVPTNSSATLLKVDTERWILSCLRLTD